MNRLIAFAAGFFAGIFGSTVAGFVHAHRGIVQSQMIYFGVPLAIAILVGLLLLLNRYFQTRLAGLGFLLAWIVVTCKLAIESSDGDLILSYTTFTSAYLVGAAVLLGIASSLKPLRPLDNGYEDSRLSELSSESVQSKLTLEERQS